MTFGEKFKSKRKRAGLSQEQIADKIGVSRAAIAKWETDRGMPDIDNLIRISEIFEASTDYFLKDDETECVSSQKKNICIKNVIIASLTFCLLAAIGVMAIQYKINNDANKNSSKKAEQNIGVENKDKTVKYTVPKSDIYWIEGISFDEDPYEWESTKKWIDENDLYRVVYLDENGEIPKDEQVLKQESWLSKDGMSGLVLSWHDNGEVYGFFTSITED